MSYCKFNRFLFNFALKANSGFYSRTCSSVSFCKTHIFNCGPDYKSQLLDVRLIFQGSHLTEQKRMKYSKRKEVKKDDSDDESDSDDELDFLAEKNSKKITSYLSIPRIDAVIKAGLGIARNKAELLFLENKIRINGYKVPKKSHRVHIGDEVDVIKSTVLDNNRLTVSRVILTSAKEVDDRDELQCKLKVYKTLEIDNYQEHPYKQPANNLSGT